MLTKKNEDKEKVVCWMKKLEKIEDENGCYQMRRGTIQ